MLTITQQTNGKLLVTGSVSTEKSYTLSPDVDLNKTSDSVEVWRKDSIGVAGEKIRDLEPGSGVNKVDSVVDKDGNTVSGITTVASLMSSLSGVLGDTIASASFFATFPFAVKKKTITLSSAEILDSGDNPVELVAAGGAGVVHKLLAYESKLDYGAATYALSANDDFGILLNDTNLTSTNLGVALIGTADNYEYETIDAGIAITDLSDAGANLPLVVGTISGGTEPITGDGTLTVTAWYISIDTTDLSITA